MLEGLRPLTALLGRVSKWCVGTFGCVCVCVLKTCVCEVRDGGDFFHLGLGGS